MTLYRKYFSSEFISSIVEGQPNWGVNVLNVGHNVHPAHTPYPDSEHPDPYQFSWKKGRILDEYQLVYIASGRGIFEAEFLGTVFVEPGTAFLLFPGIWHRYKPLDESGWEAYWVGFKGPAFQVPGPAVALASSAAQKYSLNCAAPATKATAVA